jgi:AcrR family transcriptional regulator
MIELSAERGFEAITLRELTRLAGVSTRTFYKHFPNAEECFAYTYESLMLEGLRRAHGAQRATGTWEQATRASLRSLLDDLAANPMVAKFLLVEAFAPGPSMQPRMREATLGFERLLNDSLAGDPRAPRYSRHILSGVAAGVTRVARKRLLGAESVDLDALANDLGDWAVALFRIPTANQINGKPPPPAMEAQNGEPSVPPIAGEVGDERRRILTATIKLALSGGISRLTIPRIRAEAGVSRRGFDARFADVDECFLEALEAIAGSISATAQDEARRAAGFGAEVRLLVGSFCTEAARNPLLARLAFIDIFAPGRAGYLCRERLVTLGATWIRRAAPPERLPSELLAEASVAAAWRIMHTEIAAGRARALPQLAPTLCHVLLTSAGDVSIARDTARLEESQMSL